MALIEQRSKTLSIYQFLCIPAWNWNNTQKAHYDESYVMEICLLAHSYLAWTTNARSNILKGLPPKKKLRNKREMSDSQAALCFIESV